MNLGQKIKVYRKKAGLSQMELELAIGASPGAISRIENGVVNPMKETLLEICKTLKLSGLERTDIFDIPVEEFTLIGKMINDFSEVENLEDFYQKTVNIISTNAGYQSVALFILEEEKLRLKAVSQNQLALITQKLLGKKYTELTISESKDKENLLLRCALDKMQVQTDSFVDLGRGAVPKPILKAIEKVSKFKMAVVLPLVHKNNSFGCIYFAKPDCVDYSVEIPMLQILAKQIALNYMLLTSHLNKSIQ